MWPQIGWEDSEVKEDSSACVEVAGKKGCNLMGYFAAGKMSLFNPGQIILKAGLL